MRRICIVPVILLCLAGCDKKGHLELDEYDMENLTVLPVSSNLDSWEPVYDGLEGIRTRADQFANIRWLPLRNVPSRYGYYAAEEERKGLPYSLGIFADTHIGTQVSLYTYLTAIRNPYSVMYSEDMRGAPYNGFDCASYYGTVCSNSVWYVLGIEPPYYSTMVPAIPGMKKAAVQQADAVEPFDVIWQQGHVSLIYDVERAADGSLTKVTVFETTSAGQHDTWIHSYSKEEWRSLWAAKGKVRYQYSRLGQPLDYGDSEMAYLNAEGARIIDYNLDLCVARGDKSSFREGETVTISIMNRSYNQIELYRDEELVDTRSYTRFSVQYKDLPAGLYKARLSGADGALRPSDFTFFEVLDVNASVEAFPSVKVRFSSMNASPRYVVLCDISNNPYNFYLLSDADRSAGIRDLKITNPAVPCVKVFFRGKYGVVATPALIID